MKKTIFLLAALVMTLLVLSGCFRKSIDSSPPARRAATHEGTGPAAEPGIIAETHSVDGEGPQVIEETHNVGAAGPEIIDESHEVQPAETGKIIETETAVEETTRPDIGGDDLAEEPLPAQEAADNNPAVEEAVNTAKEAVATNDELADNDLQAKEAFEPAADPENEVVMEEVEKATEAPTEIVTATTGEYYVQVGAFSDLENANKVLAGLLSEGYKGSMLVKTDNGMYRVRAGAFEDSEAAATALEALKGEFPNGYVLKAE